MKRLGFDIDGIMRPEGPTADRYLQPANHAVRNIMAAAKKAGHFIMVFTAAGWSDYRITELWLKENDFVFDVLICGKPNFDAFLDDRAMNSIQEMQDFINENS